MAEAQANDDGPQLTPDQRDTLTRWASQRAAREAVTAGVPQLPSLADQLRLIDAEYADHPRRNDDVVQENHILRRQVVILEETVRSLITGQLKINDATVQGH